ncbi:MAG: bifunctional phosphopantothenoylcysteine decarboxylase/phosphopantothenate--cysteine ligase CoaBC [Dehalococcoidia bacterium]
MPPPLEGKRVVLGVTGSIACYKAADLASKLTQAGALVDMVLTSGATRFVSPLTFHSVTQRPVVTDLFDPGSQQPLEHVALAEQADIVVVAPATANIIAKMALGLADDPLTLILLATRAPVLVAPAMDARMYDNPATQENVKRLKARGVILVGPVEGRLASGRVGKGRMVEPQELLGHIAALLGWQGDLAGRKVVVSAGGTQEPIDPVRVITNRSSGKMGHALAEAARDRGAQVMLVTAAPHLPDPVAMEVVRVRTAQEMRKAILKAVASADALLMAAAVADYRPAQGHTQKVKKGAESWTLELMRTPDILAEAQGGFIKVGFAAETKDLEQNAQAKLASKGLHLIVGNDVTAPGSGFEADTNRVVIIDREGHVERLPLLPKSEVAHRVLDRVVRLLG